MALLDVLYRDDCLVAINKPDGLLVHRNRHAPHGLAALQIFREQIGRAVYPVHRLDRATSGVLVFALDSATANRLCDAFAARRVRKLYRKRKGSVLAYLQNELVL